MSGDPGRGRRLKIGVLIADHDAPRRVEFPGADQVAHHAGRGFAPVAPCPVRGHGGVRMEWAVPYVVDRAAMPPRLVADPVQQGRHRRFIVQTARDPGLVGDDEHMPA